MDKSWFGKFLNKVNREYGQADKNIFGGLLPGGAATPIGAALPRYQRGTFSSENPTERAISSLPVAALGALTNPIGAFTGVNFAIQNQQNKPVIPSFIKGANLFAPNPNIKPQVGLDPITLKTSEVLDAAAGGIQKSQSFISDTIKNSPEFVQQGVSAGLNKLPVSANLFLRYYTGLKDKGLELPEKFTEQVSGSIEQAQKTVPATTKLVNSDVKNFSSQLNDINNALKTGQSYKEKQMGPLFPGIPMGPSKPLSGSALQNLRSQINDQLAVAKSNQNTLKQGGVFVYGNSGGGNNPLNALSTSLGSATFLPKPGGGYATNEKYDFVYGNADQRTGPFVNFDPFGRKKVLETVSPSQGFALAAAATLLNPNAMGMGITPVPASAAPTNFGRAIVSKLPELNYNYNINIPAR